MAAKGKVKELKREQLLKNPNYLLDWNMMTYRMELRLGPALKSMIDSFMNQ